MASVAAVAAVADGAAVERVRVARAAAVLLAAVERV
jgi:hypothetical protein